MATIEMEVASPRTSSGAVEVSLKIKSFRHLPKGWYYGEGVAASQDTVDTAAELHANAMILGLLKTDAFPGINGEIRITVYHGTIYLEFTIETDGLITFVREDYRRVTDSQTNLSLDDALNILRDAGREIWDSFGFSITGTTIGITSAFKPSHSETRKILTESP